MNHTPSLGELLGGAAISTLFATAFPRLAYRLRWPTRLGPGGLLAYATGLALYHLALRQYGLPRLKRTGIERLTQRLGREPTEDELAEHFGYRTSG